uniref:Uncharacterized protein n=1 Tax=Sinocyclocheilus rhinocerous TaxID=307959 RepID=A0A673GLZ1_9TELE
MSLAWLMRFYVPADNIYSAVMPQTVTALTGSCVQIPCTFNISNFEDKRKNATSINGIWLKNKSQFADKDGLIAFNSSKNIIRGFSDIQMTGDLTERNCTTVFYNIMMNHSDSYYFRLEMEPDVFKATFNPSKDVSSKTVRINVRGKCHSRPSTHQNLYEFLSSVENKRRHFEKCWYSNS